MAAKKKAAPRRKTAVNKVSVPRSMAAEEAKWRAEDDVRTLMRAQEIQADRKRMANAKKVAAQQAKEAAAVAKKLSTTNRGKKL